MESGYATQITVHAEAGRTKPYGRGQMSGENGLREQVRQLAVEVQSLRETRHEHSGLLSVIGQQVKAIEETLDEHKEDIEELDQQMGDAQLSDREQRTNWRLAIAIAGFVASLLIGLLLYIASGGGPG